MRCVTRKDIAAREFAERLDDPALELDLEARPINDVIQEICRDLGVAAHQRFCVWKYRTPGDTAARLIQGGKPASPKPPS